MASNLPRALSPSASASRAGGFLIESPKDFAARIYSMMGGAAGGASSGSGGSASSSGGAAAAAVDPEVL